MTEITPNKKLSIKNSNNKFQCEAFLDINFAPPPGTVIRDSDDDKIYLIKNGEEEIFVKLVDFASCTFNQISTLHTIAATGQDCFEWAVDWLKKYPKTTMETAMAIYCYRRIIL